MDNLNTTGGSAYGHDQLRELWIKAGGDPAAADTMAHVAYAESAGNPHAENSYNQGGRTYHVRGLWQISDIHGNDDYTDPLVNARRAVALYREQGLSPWEDSRAKGAGGGWGQYVRGSHLQKLGRIVPLPSPGGGHLTALPGSPNAGPTAAQTMQAGLVPLAPSAQAHKPPLVQTLEKSALSHMDYARQHPVEVLGDLLGFAQRGVGGAVDALEHHKGLVGALRQAGHDVINADMHTQARDTSSIETLLHAPSHTVIDGWVNQHVPAQLRPYAASILKGGEDFGAQTVSDPLNLVGIGEVGTALHAISKFSHAGDVIRAAGTALRGSHATKTLITMAAHSPALKAMLPALRRMQAAYDQVAHHYADWFHVRRELEPTFTTEGKHHFMQIEGRNLNLHAQRAFEDEHSLNNPNSARERYLQYVYDHGDAKKSNEAAHLLGRPVNPRATATLRHPGLVRDGVADFLSKTPKEQKTALAKMNREVLRGRIARQAEAYFTKYAGELKHPVGDWSKQLRSFGNMQKAQRQSMEGFQKFTGPFRDLMRATIMFNPLPHGLKNVGQLAFYAGGFRVVPEALSSMARSIARTSAHLASTGKLEVQSGLDKGVLDRLVSMGAARPSYTVGPVHSFWSKIVPGFDRGTESMQQFMGMMEESWRASLLHSLDKHLGDSKDIKDELSKGFIINDRLGDYRNQSAFVHLFQALGGPWVAFRLGIVPKNVLRTIRENPRRVLAVIRAQEDLQHNRSAKGQRMNQIDFGGPTDDFARMAFNEPGFMFSPSTLGPIGEAIQSQTQGSYAGPVERIGSLASSLNPLQQITDPITQAVQGTGMPGPNASHGRPTFQRESLADRLIMTTLKAFAVQMYREQSAQAAKRQKSQEKSIMQRDERYLQNLLRPPWQPPQGATFQ